MQLNDLESDWKTIEFCAKFDLIIDRQVENKKKKKVIIVIGGVLALILMLGLCVWRL